MARDVVTLRQTLGPPTYARRVGPLTCTILVVLSGLPGTGKSHFARELALRVPFLVLESDRLRKALVSQPQYTPGESSRLFAACHRLVEEYLAEGRRVLFDATNLMESHRQPLCHIADRLGVQLVLVRFTAPRKVVRRRLVERASGLHAADYSDADWPAYCRLLPTEERITRKHFTVGSDEDAARVLKQLIRLVKASG